MFLSDVDIKKGIKDGSIVIRPFDLKKLQPASYDVTLGNKFEVTNRHVTVIVDPVHKIYPQTRTVKIKDGDAFVLHPGESVLGKQREFIGVNREHLVLLSGKSSLARAGLVVHNTAMLFNPCHYFYPIFELVNTSNVPIVLRPGMTIAQLLFARLSSPSGRTYKETGRYGAKNSNHFIEERKTIAKKRRVTKKKK
ncbi:MAG TPA: dCTP deaminase [Candidatus Paceibacterota bacterium]|nr:dCTP deaminase [Candidatus Paceibacterota bacterium]